MILIAYKSRSKFDENSSKRTTTMIERVVASRVERIVTGLEARLNTKNNSKTNNR